VNIVKKSFVIIWFLDSIFADIDYTYEEYIEIILIFARLK